jgi:CelD/BcsL family acetyltransferase involved in cellulose biosynthesis
LATIALSPAPPLPQVKELWCELAANAEHSFFLSWPWIDTWLASLPDGVRPHLLAIREDGSPVALAIFVKQTIRRRLRRVRAWSLNTVGDDCFDQIFIEHNGLLVKNGYHERAWELCAKTFAAEWNDWDEIALRGVPTGVLDFWRAPSLRIKRDMVLTAPYVDLRRARDSGRPFVTLLGPNTRSRIRSTRRQLEAKHGPVTVRVAGTAEEALAYLAELKVLHQTRWLARGESGAFADPFFERFHTDLIRRHFADGVIQLLRVTAGEQPVGLLYNFVHMGHVLMYQTGVNYALVESKNKQSPGLLTHAVAIQHNADLGQLRYDFLAGDSQYKRALSTHADSLWWGAIQRKTLGLELLDRLLRAARPTHRRVGA